MNLAALKEQVDELCRQGYGEKKVRLKWNIENAFNQTLVGINYDEFYNYVEMEFDS